MKNTNIKQKNYKIKLKKKQKTVFYIFNHGSLIVRLTQKQRVTDNHEPVTPTQ